VNQSDTSPNATASPTAHPSADRRRRIEQGFGVLARFAHRRALSVILGAVVVFGLSAWSLTTIRFDNTAESYLHPEDPSRLRYEAFRERYGRDDGAMVGIDLGRPFELEDLERLTALHREIEREVVNAEEVKSLVNVRTQRGEDDELIVEDLLEELPETEEELTIIRERVATTPLYHNLLISEKGDFLAVMVRPRSRAAEDDYEGLDGFDDNALDEFAEEPEAPMAHEGPAPGLSPAEVETLVETLKEIIGRYDREGFRTYLVGSLPYNVSIAKHLGRDMLLCGGLTATVMCVILFLLFRRVSGVVVPMVVVLFSIVMTMGFSAAVGIPISVTTQVMPVFLLCVGICTSMHVLALFYRRFSLDGDHEHAIAWSIEHSGLAIAMASLTTAGGLFSFYFSELLPVAHLGVLGPVGVLITFILSITLLPALLSVWPMSARPAHSSTKEEGRSEQLLVACGRLAARKPKTVLLATTLVFGTFCLGLTRLELSHQPIHWFPDYDPLVISVNAVNAHLGATEGLEILIDSGRDGGFSEPENLGRLAAASDVALGFRQDLTTAPNGVLEVRSATSLANVVMESHRALNDNDPDAYRLPETREGISQELLLFESSGSDDLEKLTDVNYRETRLRLRVPLVDAVAYPAFVAELTRQVREVVGNELEFALTGTTEVLSRTLSAMLQSHIRSYVIAFCIITPLMVLMIGDLRRGLWSMVPNLIPVIACLALMGWLGIRLDGSTLLVGAIVLGLAVDDTIHFMHKFSSYYKVSGDVESAITETLRTTGLAMLFTSITIGLGFSSFAFAHMVNAQAIGLLVAFAAAVAFAADVLVAPALVAVLHAKSVQVSR
jgi:predicted RND superfamily exporter protein